MQFSEVLRLHTTGFQQNHRQGVTEDKHGGGAGGGGQIQRACLLGDVDVEHAVGVPGKR